MHFPSDNCLKISVEQHKRSVNCVTLSHVPSVMNCITISLYRLVMSSFVPLDFTYCACSPSEGWDWWSSPASCVQKRHCSAEPSNWACRRWPLFLSNTHGARVQEEFWIEFILLLRSCNAFKKIIKNFLHEKMLEVFLWAKVKYKSSFNR